MNSLLSRALELQRMAHELMYLDTNGSPCLLYTSPSPRD